MTPIQGCAHPQRSAFWKFAATAVTNSEHSNSPTSMRVTLKPFGSVTLTNFAEANSSYWGFFEVLVLGLISSQNVRLNAAGLNIS